MLTSGSRFGAYRIEDALGSGAMGEVYRAVDSRLDRVVALKLIRQELAGSSEYINRLIEEARAAAKIDSPYVVRIWECSKCDDIHFIAMEYVAGSDLTSSAGSLDLQSKLSITLQIAEGIQAAHAVGLTHSDLKPDNINLTPDNQVKILDFGLAKPIRHESLDEQGNIEGTIHYLAPEQLTGEPVSFSSDQFAFGVILYELTTGVRPFEGHYPASIIYSILHEEPIPPKDVNPDLPEWLNSFILKLLVKQPDQRFADVAAIVTHLQAGLGGEPLTIDGKVAVRRQTVTVIDLKNLSDDSSWDYFCEGFTDDVISELSRRTDLIVSEQPSQSLPRDIRDIFERCHSDFVIRGSLVRWQERIRLNLFVYGEEGERLISTEKYEDHAEQLFDLLSRAARETSLTLATVTGQSAIEVDGGLKTDISAYDYYLKGKSYYQTNRPEDLQFAANMFKKALEIDPDFALAHSGLADVFAFQYMAYYNRTLACIENAKKEALRALEIESRLAEGHRSLGRYYMFMGDTDRSEECFRKAVELNPKYAIGYRSLAWLKYQQGDYSSVLTWSNKSLQLAPTDVETLLLIGLCNTYNRKYTAAMATLQRAIEISPDYGRAYYNLGLVYMKLGVLDLALENYEKAAKYQGDPNCYIDAGFIHLILKEFDKARAAFQESILANFFPFVAYYYLGFLERTCSNQEQAQIYFENALALLEGVDFSDPENVQMQGFYALAQVGAGQTDAARKTLDLLLAHDDLIGDVWLNVARCFALLGETDAAVQYLQRAFIRKPGPTEKEVALDPHFAALRD